MPVKIEGFAAKDAEDAARIWNEVVDDGIAYPQEDDLTPPEAEKFFSSQTFTGIARDTETDEALGLYILHPNNVGRCGHIANCSYAVERSARGRHIGEILVKDSIERAREAGFRIIQFNAVVATNYPALALYRKMGFRQLGTIPGGFRMKDGSYEGIIIHYLCLRGPDDAFQPDRCGLKPMSA